MDQQMRFQGFMKAAVKADLDNEMRPPTWTQIISLCRILFNRDCF